MPAFCLLSLVLSAGAPPPADLVLTGGKVWTGDPRNKEAAALAVRGGRVVAVGTTAAVRELVGPETKVIDLKGRRVVAGFHDSHVHVLGGGLALARVALKDA